MLPRRMMPPQRSISERVKAANSSGVVVDGVDPIVSRRARTWESRQASTISRLSRASNYFGVPLGA